MNKGDKVIVKECHKLPELVGAEAVVRSVGLQGPYPIAVEIDGALYGFREEELELATEVPPVFQEA